MVREKLYSDYAGIRPKLSRQGEPARDFLIAEEVTTQTTQYAEEGDRNIEKKNVRNRTGKRTAECFPLAPKRNTLPHIPFSSCIVLSTYLLLFPIDLEGIRWICKSAWYRVAWTHFLSRDRRASCSASPFAQR